MRVDKATGKRVAKPTRKQATRNSRASRVAGRGYDTPSRAHDKLNAKLVKAGGGKRRILLPTEPMIVTPQKAAEEARTKAAPQKGRFARALKALGFGKK